eukprot:CAMPEP_0197073344 /NCGR_PEP_ID=MMETSP1384-20130603/210556_1 /TAXON_ID=29189 /ORGANISM="Ammonia sp." /LENGTH=2115 /DNA_ID=CAMNT_0042512181 /DNA_START=59 /DNA_END=6403 /DNA_ORIENTATION=+
MSTVAKDKKSNTNNEGGLCEFFVKNGYCTLGEKCKLTHDRTKYRVNVKEGDGKETEEEEEDGGLTEICFSFDTTGSMYGYLKEVRRSIRELISELFEKIQNIRISIIAHGDYCDAGSTYVLKSVDFTRDHKKLIEFVQNVGPTGGGDAPECYELVLWHAAHKLHWSPHAKSKALVVIGDDEPHPVSYSMNVKGIDWRVETENLRRQNCTIYGIFCGYSSIAKRFYQEISTKTNGTLLELSNMKNMVKLFMALCLRNSNNPRLLAEYRARLMRDQQCDNELEKALNALGAMVKNTMTTAYHHTDSTFRHEEHSKTQRKAIPSAVRRLMADLNELKREKLHNISIVPQPNNVFKWHVNVKPLEGALTDLYIHFVLHFPNEYPTDPPSIELVTKIPDNAHENIEYGTVCLPQFKSHSWSSSEAKKRARYSSSWSAAYSITSLLLNISSIFSEIEALHKDDMKKARKRQCTRCGHRDTCPYPPLEQNKIPIDLTEYDYNDKTDAERKREEKEAKKKGKRVRQQWNERGATIAGNIIETHRPDQWWIVKSMQDIKRMDKCVAWQFKLDWFDPKETESTKKKKKEKANKEETFQLYSDLVFGFTNDKNIFFGVDIDGYVVFNNERSQNRLYGERVQQGDTMTYIVKFGDEQEKDQIIILRNYREIAAVPVRPYVFEDVYRPQMFLKNTRIQLSITQAQCNAMVKQMKCQKVNRSEIYFMDDLPQFGRVSLTKTNWSKHEYYKDQKSWNGLFERAFSTDVLLEICAYLSYVDLIRCKNVCQHWHEVLLSCSVIDRNEMNCFYTKESIESNHECILGVGLNIEYSSNNWITSITTEMDFLSLNSYIDYNIKQGVWGEPITHFLPLVINEQHGNLAASSIIKRLSLICHPERVSAAKLSKFDHETALLALTAIMNQFVVQLMHSCMGHIEDGDDDDEKKPDEHTKGNYTNSAEAKHASEKALVGYCAFHHLLLYLTLKYPKMKRIAEEKLGRFINDEAHRHKMHTPDLGKLLLNLVICYKYSWDDLKESFIKEGNIRNIKWALQKYPDLEYMDTDKCPDNYRIESMLKSTTVSRRLIAFQIWFIQNIARPSEVTSRKELLLSYNRRWGRPTNRQKASLMKVVKEVLAPEPDYRHTQWIRYFESVGIGGEFKSKQDVLNYLRANVEESRRRSYHRANGKALRENRMYSMKCKFNVKQEMYQRTYITPRTCTKLTISANPAKFEGIQIAYKNDKDANLDQTKWVNIFDEATHRWYLGYILRLDEDAQVCDVYYVGWNKQFVTKDIKIPSEVIAKYGTFPLSLKNNNFKQGYIFDDSVPNAVTDQQLMEEYEAKLDLERRIKQERYEKIAFYHREFFKAITDNDIDKVKRFLNGGRSPGEQPNADGECKEDETKTEEAQNQSNDDNDDNDDNGDDDKEDAKSQGTQPAETEVHGKEGKEEKEDNATDSEEGKDELKPKKSAKRKKRGGGKKKEAKSTKPVKVASSFKRKHAHKWTKSDDLLFGGISKKNTGKRRNNKKRFKHTTVTTNFYHEDETAKPPKPQPKTKEETKMEKFVDREVEKERLYWKNFDIVIDKHMTDAFGRSPLFISCFMGKMEMTNLLLQHGFSAIVEDINGETALDQILYGKKKGNFEDKESMELYDVIANAMQAQRERERTMAITGNNNHRRAEDKFYVHIGGLSEVSFENEVIDLCETYGIYPNEIIMNKGYAIIGVNDIGIVAKIYAMDEAFYRCSILSAVILEGNAYNTTAKVMYPTNSLFVSGFDSVRDVDKKLNKIFMKYGKMRKDSLVIKPNKFGQNFTFVEYFYVKDAIYAYNDINVNRHQHKFKLNSNPDSNRRIFVKFNRNSGGFGGRLGAGGRTMRVNGFANNTNNGFKNSTNGKNQKEVRKTPQPQATSSRRNQQRQGIEEEKEDALTISATLPWEMTSNAQQTYLTALCFIPPHEICNPQRPGIEEEKEEALTISATLPWEMTSNAQQTYLTALCFIPPHEIWPQIQEIRRFYDPTYTQWMPHLSIFSPFVNERYLKDIAKFLHNDVVKPLNIKPFNVTLSKFDVSDRIKRQLQYGGGERVETMFLKPDNKALSQMQLLYSGLTQVWEEFAVDAYQPHLAVGKFKMSDLLYYKMQFQAKW